MLDAIVQVKEVFSRYGDRDSNFEWVPSVKDCGQGQHVCQLLSIVIEVTNIVSISNYSTKNIFLSKVWRMNDMLSKKFRDENEYMKPMLRKISSKFEKYWGEYNLFMEIAIVLDPRFKTIPI